MRSFALAALAALTAVACTTKRETPARQDTTTPAAATTTSNTDVAAVRHAIDSLNARFSAAFSKGDAATMASNYADDAVTLPPNMKADHGHAEIEKSLTGMFSAVTVSAATVQAQDVTVSGDYAFETGTYEMTAKPKAGGKAQHDVGKYLVVWKKQADGGWKIYRDAWNSDEPAAPTK